MENEKIKQPPKTKKEGVRRKIRSIIGKKRFMSSILIAIVIIIFGYIYFSSFETTDDAFIEGHVVRISPKVSGIISQILINDNQHVKTGDLLIKIDDNDYKVRFEQAKAAYEMALFRQKSAVADKNALQIDYDLAKRDLERYTNLYEKGAVSKQDLDRAKAKFEATGAKLTTAGENILSVSGDKVADAELKKLEAAMKQAELELSYTSVFAGEDGKITNRSAEEGAFIHAGAPMFSIVPDKRWIIANFKETQLGKMEIGQDVDIKVDAYPRHKFKGKVDSIQSSTGSRSSLFPPENAVGSFVKVVQRVPVKIVFTDKIPSQYNIEPGMSVVPKVYLK